jgi:hypothetical protein
MVQMKTQTLENFKSKRGQQLPQSLYQDCSDCSTVVRERLIPSSGTGSGAADSRFFLVGASLIENISIRCQQWQSAAIESRKVRCLQPLGSLWVSEGCGKTRFFSFFITLDPRVE